MNCNDFILAPDGELYHYGVVGMKWGVIRAKARSKMASNDAYVSMMKKRVSSLDKEKLKRIEGPFLEEFRSKT